MLMVEMIGVVLVYVYVGLVIVCARGDLHYVAIRGQEGQKLT